MAARPNVQRRQRARDLRSLGYSYTEIRQELGGGSQSSIHKWVSDIELSEDAKQRIKDKVKSSAKKGGHNPDTIARLSQANRDRRVSRWSAARSEADEEWDDRRSDPDFMFGLGLYIGEGDKHNGNCLGFSNCDPAVMRLGIGFYELIGVARADVNPNVQLPLALEDRADDAVTFWSNELGIHRDRFKKTVIDRRRGNGKSDRNPWPNGCCHVRVHSTQLKQKVLRWMELAVGK